MTTLVILYDVIYFTFYFKTSHAIYENCKYQLQILLVWCNLPQSFEGMNAFILDTWTLTAYFKSVFLRRFDFAGANFDIFGMYVLPQTLMS